MPCISGVQGRRKRRQLKLWVVSLYLCVCGLCVMCVCVCGVCGVCVVCVVCV